MDGALAGGEGFRRITTALVRPKHRVDYWRSLHTSIRIEPAARGAAADFAGDMVCYRARNGSAFSYTTSADTLTTFGGSDADFFMLSVVLAGRTRLRSARGREVVAQAGDGVVLLDSRAQVEISTTGLSHAYITLPKRLLGADQGAGLLIGGEGFRKLPDVGLTRFLRRHLEEMAACGETLDETAAETVMAAAVQFGVAALQQSIPLDDPAPSGGELFEAAQSLIRIRAGHHDLTAESLAHTLGCSRAQLYRIFSERDCAVGESIRDARIARARALLAEDPTAPIKVVAHRSGYENTASFIRAFRTRTGVTPAVYRESLGPFGA